jgi:hypothetical protein
MLETAQKRLDRTLTVYMEMVQYSEGSPFNSVGSSPRMSVAHFFPPRY